MPVHHQQGPLSVGYANNLTGLQQSVVDGVTISVLELLIAAKNLDNENTTEQQQKYLQVLRHPNCCRKGIIGVSEQ